MNKEGLLKTIVVPNNLANLHTKLPKANYSVQSTRQKAEAGKQSLLTQKNLQQVKSMKDIQPPRSKPIAPVNVRASQAVPSTKVDLLNVQSKADLVASP